MALALNSGIPVSVWWAEEPRDLATALDILDRERQEQEKTNPRTGKVVDSG